MNTENDYIKIEGKKPIFLSLNSEINPQTTNALISALMHYINEKFDEIHFLLSTPGRLVAEGITIYNYIQSLPIPVVIYNMGIVNSIGNVIYQAGKKRISATNSSFMFHGVGFDVTNARFEQKQLEEQLGAIKNDQELISNIMVRIDQG